MYVVLTLLPLQSSSGYGRFTPKVITIKVNVQIAEVLKVTYVRWLDIQISDNIYLILLYIHVTLAQICTDLSNKQDSVKRMLTT